MQVGLCARGLYVYLPYAILYSFLLQVSPPVRIGYIPLLASTPISSLLNARLIFIKYSFSYSLKSLINAYANSLLLRLIIQSLIRAHPAYEESLIISRLSSILILAVQYFRLVSCLSTSSSTYIMSASFLYKYRLLGVGRSSLFRVLRVEGLDRFVIVVVFCQLRVYTAFFIVVYCLAQCVQFVVRGSILGILSRLNFLSQEHVATTNASRSYG